MSKRSYSPHSTTDFDLDDLLRVQYHDTDMMDTETEMDMFRADNIKKYERIPDYEGYEGSTDGLSGEDAIIYQAHNKPINMYEAKEAAYEDYLKLMSVAEKLKRIGNKKEAVKYEARALEAKASYYSNNNFPEHYEKTMQDVRDLKDTHQLYESYEYNFSSEDITNILKASAKNSNYENTKLAEKALNSPNANSNHIALALDDNQSSSVHGVALEHPLFGPEHMPIIRRSKKPYLMRYALKTPYSTRKDFLHVLNSNERDWGSETSRIHALYSRHATREDLQQHMEHPDPEIRSAAMRAAEAKGYKVKVNIHEVNGVGFVKDHNGRVVKILTGLNEAPVSRRFTDDEAKKAIGSGLKQSSRRFTDDEVKKAFGSELKRSKNKGDDQYNIDKARESGKLRNWLRSRGHKDLADKEFDLNEAMLDHVAKREFGREYVINGKKPGLFSDIEEKARYHGYMGIPPKSDHWQYLDNYHYGVRRREYHDELYDTSVAAGATNPSVRDGGNVLRRNLEVNMEDFRKKNNNLPNHLKEFEKHHQDGFHGRSFSADEEQDFSPMIGGHMEAAQAYDLGRELRYKFLSEPEHQNLNESIGQRLGLR